ncbi:ADP-ribosylation factor [Spraguea lophii 42_110]|uniref:ADP-ribosylation factor n=1 Tax=Spraguea lophii (strain 42_110) TaxID=1358809 RepID=S7W867_SPRLO|nr:ADP-ribosylation factor [Spraguea lophii 42_110]
MVFNCCSPAIRCRMIVIGLDRPGKRRFYSKLTGEHDEIENTLVKHLEQKIEYNGLQIYLCLLDENEGMRKLWSCNAKLADALIYVIDAADSKNFDYSVSEFKTIIEGEKNIEKMNVLLFCNNATNMDGRLNVLEKEYGGYKNISVFPCRIEEWENVDQGMKWLSKRVKSKYKSFN